MPCTTILVGKKASYNGSTRIARNDDSPSGQFHVKKRIVVEPKDQVRTYTNKGGKLTIELPDNPLRFTRMPNVDPKEGVWPAAGINSANVSRTATETITSNERVLGADPYVEPHRENGKKVPGGIGEEDLVLLVLPYIHSAREGVLRLGSLLEEYGTYEPNGIGFSDEKEIWWLETIGGHNWIAKRVPDNQYVVRPNQFGIDAFDFKDAEGVGENHLCSKGLREFVIENHLALDRDDNFNPRLAFGSHSDSDHVYNTPRAWYRLRYFNPHFTDWDNGSRYTPESDDLPWAMVPESKITLNEVKYILSSHYQGTIYDPYGKKGTPETRSRYRPIGINRTSFLSCSEIRPFAKEDVKSIFWLAYGSNAFNAFAPIFTNVDKIPAYYSNTTRTVSTENFYWASRLLAALADPHFNVNSIHIERYQDAVREQSYKIITGIDKKENLSTKEIETINDSIAKRVKKETDKALNNVLYSTSRLRKNSFSRSDN